MQSSVNLDSWEQRNRAPNAEFALPGAGGGSQESADGSSSQPHAELADAP